MDSLCHPCITTIHLSYNVLSLKLPPSPCAVLLVHQYIHFFTMARQEGRGRHWRGGAEDGQAPTPKVLPKGNVRLKRGVKHGKPMENHGKPMENHGKPMVFTWKMVWKRENWSTIEQSIKGSSAIMTYWQLSTIENFQLILGDSANKNGCFIGQIIGFYFWRLDGQDYFKQKSD